MHEVVTHLRLLHRPVVLISSLDLSREALVNLAQAVRQDAQVLLDLGLLLFLLQNLPVDLSKPRKKNVRATGRAQGGARRGCAGYGARTHP